MSMKAICKINESIEATDDESRYSFEVVVLI